MAVLRQPLAVNRDVSQSRGMVALWAPMVAPGANILVDLVGGHNGAMGTSTAMPAWDVDPRFGPVVDFDGSDDYVRVPDSPDLRISDSITLAAWVYPHDLGVATKYTTVIAKRDKELSNVNYELRVGHDAWRSVNDCIHFAYRVGTSWHLWDTDSLSDLTMNTWHHVAVTFTYGTGSSIRAYLNGVDVSSGGSWGIGNGNTTPNSDTHPVSIGDGNTDGTAYTSEFDGPIAQVGLWNRILTPDEIWQMWADPQLLYAPEAPVWIPSAGGTTYNQSASGSLTPSAALVLMAGLSPDGSLTPSGTMTRQSAKSPSGAVTPVGTQTRGVSKNTLGAMTPTGAQSRQTGKGASGVLAPTGTQTRQTSKGADGAMTPTGTQTRAVSVTKTGEVTPTGAETRQTNKTPSGTITPSGAETRQTDKGTAGSVEPSGGLAKQIAAALSGGLTPSGVLDVSKVILQAVAGVLGLSGTLARRANKTAQGSVAPTGAQSRAVRFSLTGALTPVGSLAKRIAMSAAGTLTPAATLVATLTSSLKHIAWTLWSRSTAWTLRGRDTSWTLDDRDTSWTLDDRD